MENGLIVMKWEARNIVTCFGRFTRQFFCRNCQNLLM